MPTASITKKILCSKKNLIKVVLDIEKYPEFVPWCLGGKIHTIIDKGNKVEITADLTIGKSFFNETYKSFVIYDKSADSIHVTNIGGPLKHLENKWTFRQTGDSSEVDFHVDFELKNKILNILMIKTFDLGLKKIADAFEKRANELFNKT
ncbi:MAG: ubiquinone-binding protein [Candidatus Pelagibacter sp.]|jgi:coenzyme Q-binding protein COQ10|nr:ubiquinone-binding protein [Candidatus Pelagibacter sp.]MDP6440170.1 type II toxin-antitoxin system RatA family toxin [Pelagibacteraceae bacterium]|tara:strand:- start:7913 stop:8362 length:450 start_codon:yes stop_codon:yes gene_type:complete